MESSIIGKKVKIADHVSNSLSIGYKNFSFFQDYTKEYTIAAAYISITSSGLCNIVVKLEEVPNKYISLEDLKF